MTDESQGSYEDVNFLICVYSVKSLNADLHFCPEIGFRENRLGSPNCNETLF